MTANGVALLNEMNAGLVYIGVRQGTFTVDVPGRGWDVKVHNRHSGPAEGEFETDPGKDER